MIELRWVLTGKEWMHDNVYRTVPVLQYRQRPDIDTRSLPTGVVIGYNWSEWQDVPTVRDDTKDML